MSNLDQYKEVLERCFDDIAALRKAHKEAVEFSNDLLDENNALQERIAALEAENAKLKTEAELFGEIMAIIHRDGGHHTESVGAQQSYADALAVWGQMQIEIDALREAAAELLDGITRYQYPNDGAAVPLPEFASAANKLAALFPAAPEEGE